jgi:hypothetical protein
LVRLANQRDQSTKNNEYEEVKIQFKNASQKAAVALQLLGKRQILGLMKIRLDFSR